MNKQELVEAVSRATGLSKANIDRAIKGTLHNIAAALSRGEKVTLVGFGTFERRQRKARTGVNPQNPQERIQIPAKKAPAFSAGSELKSAVATGRPPRLSLEPIAKASSSKAKGKGKKSKGKR